MRFVKTWNTRGMLSADRDGGCTFKSDAASLPVLSRDDRHVAAAPLVLPIHCQLGILPLQLAQQAADVVPAVAAALRENATPRRHSK